MQATFLHLETVFPIPNFQERIAWAISCQAHKHA